MDNDTNHDADLGDYDLTTTMGRLRFAIHESGFAVYADFARKIGVRPRTLTEALRSEDQNRGYRFAWKVAEATGFTVRWLETGEGPKRPKSGDDHTTHATDYFEGDDRQRLGPYTKVVGAAAAGTWKPVDDLTDEPLFEIPVGPHPDYAIYRHFGLLVEGTSVNNVIEDGAIALCVDINELGEAYQPRHGDLVAVLRSRFQGAEREVTIKRVHAEKGTLVLRPDSRDAKWAQAEPLQLNDGAEDTTTEIVGLVVQAYSDLLARRARSTRSL